MLFYAAASVHYARNNNTIQYKYFTQPNQRGLISDMPSTGSLLDIYVSLTRTNGSRCEDRREVPTLKPGQGGQAVSKRVGIHTSGPSVCCDITKAGTAA